MLPAGFRFFAIVRPNECYMVERFGRFHRKLESGLHFMLPVVDNVSRKISYKEVTKNIVGQEVITKDSIDIQIDGLLYYRVTDAYRMAYSSTDAERSVEIMAQSLLRCEIGKLALDSVLHERQQLNRVLLEEIAAAADRWGIECFRYEITNVNIDEKFAQFMNFEAESERYKRKLSLDASSIEVTAINNAQRERTVSINRRTAEAKALYFQYKVLAERMAMLAGLTGQQAIDPDILELKLRQDLITAYSELSAGDKSIFLKKDLASFEGVFGELRGMFEASEKETAKFGSDSPKKELPA